MTTVNKRILQPQAMTINSIAAGGLTQHQIQFGYDNTLQHPIDGLALSQADLVTEFVRGSFTSQDWLHLIELLTGSVGTSVFYQRKSGAAEATGYIKHTLNKPIIHRASLKLTHRAYAEASGSFECMAADETEGISDLWVMTDAQSAPTHVTADRGLEITACVLGSLSLYHVTGLDFELQLPLAKASQDGDVGYTAVDALTTGMTASGTLRLQDAGIVSSQLTVVDMVKAARGSLVLTIKQSQGAAAKTLTIAGVKFTGGGHNTSAGKEYDEFSVPFIIANDAGTPLTLAGPNKIITIA